MFLLVLPLLALDLHSVCDDKWVFLLSCGVMPPLILVMRMSIGSTEWREHLITLVRVWYSCSWSKWYSADMKMCKCKTGVRPVNNLGETLKKKKKEKLQLDLNCVCFKNGMEYWKSQCKENNKRDIFWLGKLETGTKRYFSLGRVL